MRYKGEEPVEPNNISRFHATSPKPRGIGTPHS